MVSKKEFDKGVKYLESLEGMITNLNKEYKCQENELIHYHIIRKTITYQIIRSIRCMAYWELNIYKINTITKYKGNTPINLWFNIENNIVESIKKGDR